jgi:integrase/recombinase XerD
MKKEEFIQYLTNLGKSQNTILSYTKDVEQYFGQFSILNRSNILKYRKQISNLGSTTINRKLSSIRKYNEFLINNKEADQLYIIKADYIKIQEKGNPTSIPERTILDFLANVRQKKCLYSARNIVLIYLMANSGIRREECSNIKVKDINFETNKLRVMGKGGKEREVILNDTTIQMIWRYLKDRSFHKNADSEYLFLSERGEKLTKETINDIFTFYSTPNCKVNPHALRHNWCSTMLENNLYTIVEVKNQAGHSFLSTTELYTHPRQDKMLEKIRNFSIG